MFTLVVAIVLDSNTIKLAVMMQKRVDVLEIIIQAQLDWFKFATFSPAKHIVCQSTLPARQRGPGESFRLLKYTVGKRKIYNILAIYCFTFLKLLLRGFYRS